MIHSIETICSQALVMLGASPIDSLNENSVESLVARHIYETTYKTLLASHTWNFAQKKLLLSNPSFNTENSTYTFPLPEGLIRILAIASGQNQIADYSWNNNEIETSQREILISMIATVEESHLPHFFIQALVSTLAAEFCLPITESTSRADYLSKQATQKIENAKLIDSQQAQPQSLAEFPLIEARGS